MNAILREFSLRVTGSGLVGVCHQGAFVQPQITDDDRLDPGTCFWRRQNGTEVCSVVTSSRHSAIAQHADLMVVVRGYATLNQGGVVPANPAEVVLRYYQEHSQLPTDLLEGSYVIILIDMRTVKIWIFRNLAGAVNVYYQHTADAFFFATNLADLITSTQQRPQPNVELLPTFFLFRCIPGQETLFKDVFRVMPGDLLQFSPNRVDHRRFHRLGDLKGKLAVCDDVVGQVDDTLASAVADCTARFSNTAVLLSGGVDSTYLQSHWNDCVDVGSAMRKSFCVTLDHPRTADEFPYARSAAQRLGVELIGIPIDRPYSDYLMDVIERTAETPNHVQAAYFPHLASAMLECGVDVGISGEAGDGIFGVATAYEIQFAQRLQGRIPSAWTRRLLSHICVTRRLNRLKKHLCLSTQLDNLRYIEHPVNQQAAFAHFPSVEACFGRLAIEQALEYRRELIRQHHLDGSLLEQLHAANLLTSSINSASLWNTLFETRGAIMLSPFLDSRVLRVAMNIDEKVRFPFGKPKDILKQGLARRVPSEFADRKKLGFGQPIFEWMPSGGQLESMITQISDLPFVSATEIQRLRQNSNWFLYSLLCYDLWHKKWITNRLPNTVGLRY